MKTQDKSSFINWDAVRNACTLLFISFSCSTYLFAQHNNGEKNGGRNGFGQGQNTRRENPGRQQSIGLDNRRPFEGNNNRGNFNRTEQQTQNQTGERRRAPVEDYAFRGGTDRSPSINRPSYNTGNEPGGYGGNNYRRPNNADFNNNATNARPSYNTNYRNGNSPAYNRNNNYNYRRPVYNPYNPNWCYAYTPRRNSFYNQLPASYININFGGFGYRYYDGIYYRPYNNLFRVVAPPIGICINVLPLGYRRIYVRNYPYYYYNGTYYDHRNNNYTVVSPPVGAVVESIPDGYKTITIDGETYYEADGAQYKPVVQGNGEVWYEVIKSN